ncbi:MAG: carbohydrate kinase [Dysgonamonadaceae bacterium]|jgi:fructokinase|nr:carbohydrate kinase [Dysgonamonadaceae bacterium]
MTKKQLPKVLGIGEILWDCLPDGKVLGGAPANFAYHAAQFGFEGYAVSAVGKDSSGKEILDVLAEKRLNNLIERVDYPTGTVQVTLDDKGVPKYEICENTAWDNIPFTAQMEALARNCKAVCFGSLAQRSKVSRETILRFLELVPNDSLKIFDINLRQHFYSKEIIHNSLVKCNILKINEEEVIALAKLFYNCGSDPQFLAKVDLAQSAEIFEQDFCKRLLKAYNLKMVIETKGAIGSYVFTADETSYIDTLKVQVADTVGAGDSFTGAFTAALLQGKSIREAHKLGVDISAYVCTQKGAMPITSNQIKAS